MKKLKIKCCAKVIQPLLEMGIESKQSIKLVFLTIHYTANILGEGSSRN